MYFWRCFCFSDQSKNFYTHSMAMFKISRWCPWFIFSRSYKNWNRTTHQSKDMHGKAKKLRSKKRFGSFKKNSIFEGVFAFQITLKSFLRIQRPCSRYVEGAPRSYLYARTKIGTVRHINQNICTEKQKTRVFWKIGFKKAVGNLSKNSVFEGVFAFQIKKGNQR